MPQDPASTIANIVQGATDSAGVVVERVYARVTGAYAIYRTAQGVIVQFADDPTLGGQQRQALAPLNPLRSDINGLIDGWRDNRDPVRRGRGVRFDARVAAALNMALQGDVASAEAALAAIKTDIIDLRTSVARTRYVIVAGATMAVLTLALLIMQSSWFGRLPDYDPAANPFWAAAAIGAIGAWFSIALAIRGRTIHTDLQTRDNDVDAVLRVMIGAISAAILLALLRLGLVSFVIGGSSVAAGNGLIVVAFAAGFSERLVSDFFTQQIAGALRVPGAPAPTAGAQAPAIAAAAGVNEMHPLGQSGAGPAAPTQPVAPAPPEPHVAEPVAISAAPAPSVSPAPLPVAVQADTQAGAQAHDDDHADGCGAGLNVPAAEQTADADLPPTAGGVAGPASAAH